MGIKCCRDFATEGGHWIDDVNAYLRICRTQCRCSVLHVNFVNHYKVRKNSIIELLDVTAAPKSKVKSIGIYFNFGVTSSFVDALCDYIVRPKKASRERST